MGGCCSQKADTVPSIFKKNDNAPPEPVIQTIPVEADPPKPLSQLPPPKPDPTKSITPPSSVQPDSPRIQPIPVEADPPEFLSQPSTPKPETPSPIIQPSPQDPPQPIISPSPSLPEIDDVFQSYIDLSLPTPDSSIALVTVPSVPPQNVPIVPEVSFQLQVKDIKGLTDFTIAINPKWKGLQLFEKIKEKTGGNREFQVLHFGKLIKCDEEEIGSRGLSKDTLIYCIFKPKSLQ